MSRKIHARISLVGELTSTAPEGICLVNTDQDYIHGCRLLAGFWEHSQPLVVWVRARNHFSWLRDFTEQIGCVAVFEEQTARTVLAEQWNVVAPDWLTDADVLNNHLLDLSVEAKKRVSFETRYLTHVLGPLFASEMLEADQAVGVVHTLADNEEAQAALAGSPLLSRCLEMKCRQWAKSGDEAWVRDLASLLPARAKDVWHWLSLWAGLRTYPEKLLEFVLPPQQALFVRNIPLSALEDMPLEPGAREQIESHIEAFLRDMVVQVDSPEFFHKLLGMTSGKLLLELRYLARILKSRKFEPSKQDVTTLQHHFKTCPGLLEGRLAALAYCIKPDRPSRLNPEEPLDAEGWVQWTTKEYIPYRAWQVHNKQHDADLEQSIVQFSDWYVREYAAVNKDADRSLAHCLRRLPDHDAEVVYNLVLIVDCLPFTFFPLLDTALRTKGFRRHDLQFRFAALPTTTQFNKSTLLSGKWEDSPKAYPSILKKRAASDWNGTRVEYLSSLKALADVRFTAEPTVAVLNFLDGDELLHADVESKLTTYEEELHRVFTRLADAVHKFAENWPGTKEQLAVHVVTDHGACRILDQERTTFESQVVDKLFADEQYRYAAVPKDKADDVPKNLWDLGYRFKRTFTRDETTYFLPKGHNTVQRGNASGNTLGYMHGGATPEEVIVPMARYKLVKAARMSLASRFVGLDLLKETGRAKFFIQRVVAIEVEILNPNTVDIHVLRASVLAPEAEIKNSRMATIKAESTGLIHLDCYFQRSALGEKDLELEFVYEIAGEEQTLEMTLDCDFRSAMSGGFSLKDL